MKKKVRDLQPNDVTEWYTVLEVEVFARSVRAKVRYPDGSEGTRVWDDRNIEVYCSENNVASRNIKSSLIRTMLRTEDKNLPKFLDELKGSYAVEYVLAELLASTNSFQLSRASVREILERIQHNRQE